MDRQQWLAVRDSGSLGQCLRSRERFVHVSKMLEVVWAEQRFGDVHRYGAIEFLGVCPDPGRPMKLGRNAAKRALRNGSRKTWRTLPRAV